MRYDGVRDNVPRRTIAILRKSLHVDATTGNGAVDVFRALGNETRVEILRYLGDRVLAVNQIAQGLDLKPSTATMHITILERAGMLHTELLPASRGLQKVCARTYDELVFDLPSRRASVPGRGRCRDAHRWFFGLLGPAYLRSGHGNRTHRLSR